MDTVVRLNSAAEALAYCRILIESGAADLFRGQSNDWPTISPSLFRGTEDVRNKARSLLNDFKEWSSVVPQMAAYRDSDDGLTAIAQHYGIPTPFLDLTTAPNIAELFARAAIDNSSVGDAVIYCFKRSDLERLTDFRLVEIDVANLWRLQAQSGLFLEYQNEGVVNKVRERATRIYFPRSAITLAETTTLYPLRKSALELIIDQWIYRNKVTQLFDGLSGVKINLMIRRYTYPGMFRWRKVPEFDADWVKYNPGWVFPAQEHVSTAVTKNICEISIDNLDDVKEAIANLEEQFRDPVALYAHNEQHVEFEVRIEGHAVASVNAGIILNRCWDGIRVHPYRFESAVRCMAATSLALIRRILCPDAADWEPILWGEVEHIDTAPVGGHLDAAVVSKADFAGALHSDYYDRFTSFAARKTNDDPLFVLDYIVDPWVLFDFEKLSTMFVEQFIPSCIGSYWNESQEDGQGQLGELWGVSFNAALLAFVTRFGFRFYSPIATEKDVDRIVLISADMNEDDIEEVFVSCLPAILAGGKPYVVKFTDYSAETKGIWEIDRAVEQCKTIIKVGGISVLDVIPGLHDEASDDPLAEFGGLGAFHIWAIGTGRFSEVNGVEFGKIRHVFDEFMRDLAYSNANLEARGRAQPDWPS